jgi:transcriptional regulator with PAS, ATPase and Fis domain
MSALGNVRELRHVMERASILLEKGDTVLPEHLYFHGQGATVVQPHPRLATWSGREA